VRFVGTTVTAIRYRVSKSHRIPQTKEFRANTQHTTAARRMDAVSLVKAQVSRLNMSRHAARPIGIRFTERNGGNFSRLETCDSRCWRFPQIVLQCATFVPGEFFFK